MRVDSSPILLAGQAQAQANQAFGNAVGGVIDKFYQKKKDKQERDERERAYREAGLNAEEAKAASGDKELGSLFINKMNADRNFLIEQEKAKRAADLFNFQKQDYENRFEERERLLKEAEELKEKTAGFEKYLSKQPQAIDQTGPGRFDVLRNLREGKGVTPPARMIPGASPAEEMLMSPEAKSFARRAVEGGQPMSLVMPMAQKIDSQIAAQTPKPYSPTELIALRQLEKPSLTVGEETIDREFAKSIIEFNPADIEKGLTQLREASARLGGTAKDEDGNAIEPENLTGVMVGIMPDSFNDIINPEASEVKEAVEEVVQRNLRLVLGAQFTEKEGQRLISRAYNPRLDETENKKRVDRLIKSIESAMKEKQSQARYFNENSTLKGYQFAPISIQSIERDAFGENSNDPSAPASQATLDELEKKRQLRSKRAGL